ncbi:MAG: hypothetical protein BZY79_00765 [SAR202 cluster bacterium Casp-Chloro-G4]|nr:hypothetical protein [Chloroflexota bacterium]MDA1227378.1 hypothetical protein [Chloroflexota bacterium]PKB62012.1 MAG: hypothetical protein BZY79_00765 [SAR202 cluster bacterium Casp-Chloro-G4]
MTASGRIFLANVGANASHSFDSPIFDDGTFEFITIPEDQDLPGDHAVRYGSLTSFYDPGKSIQDYIPQRLWNFPTHFDPEFETFTYGDNCETSPRAASLKRMAPGDFIFFLARLTREKKTKEPSVHGFYLVGFLEIEGILKDVTQRPTDVEMERYGTNAHVLRGLSDKTLWDRFWVFAGTPNSRRFRRAVPVTRELALQVFSSAGGSPWKWDTGRSDLQVIGSYTRSCRCVIDPATPGQAEKATIMWDWVARHS